MTTIDQTRTAAAGTDTYLLTPNISMLAATPANSAVVVQRLAIMKPRRRTTVGLTPKRSRMRSARPLPVTTPIRAHISCTTNRAKVMGMRSQRREYPK